MSGIWVILILPIALSQFLITGFGINKILLNGKMMLQVCGAVVGVLFLYTLIFSAKLGMFSRLAAYLAAALYARPANVWSVKRSFSGKCVSTAARILRPGCSLPQFTIASRVIDSV